MTTIAQSHVELGRGTYSAVRVPGSVIVTAGGHTPTPGYRVWLEPAPVDVFPPQYELKWLPPTTPVPQVLTPFQVSASFAADNSVHKLTVVDLDGTHPVDVVELDAAPDRDSISANYFQVTIPGRLVTYTATDIAGQPRLTYDRREFKGKEIRREETAIGELVTVTLESVPDARVTNFSLLVPRVGIEPRGMASVRLPGITATVLHTIAGPPPGQSTVYRVDEFVGTAAHVAS